MTSPLRKHAREGKGGRAASWAWRLVAAAAAATAESRCQQGLPSHAGGSSRSTGGVQAAGRQQLQAWWWLNWAMLSWVSKYLWDCGGGDPGAAAMHGVRRWAAHAEACRGSASALMRTHAGVQHLQDSVGSRGRRGLLQQRGLGTLQRPPRGGEATDNVFSVPCT